MAWASSSAKWKRGAAQVSGTPGEGTGLGCDLHLIEEQGTVIRDGEGPLDRS
jgi:hypothetical protein